MEEAVKARANEKGREGKESGKRSRGERMGSRRVEGIFIEVKSGG